jgi:hypothetical protein
MVVDVLVYIPPAPRNLTGVLVIPHRPRLVADIQNRLFWRVGIGRALGPEDIVLLMPCARWDRV